MGLGKTVEVLTAIRELKFNSLLSGAEARIREAISDICVRMKAEDYLSLPDYIEDVVPVALDAATKKAYDKLECEMLLQVE